MKTRIWQWISSRGLLALLVMGCTSGRLQPVQAHPKSPHPEIDVQHYVFRLSLSDTTNQINGEATINLRFKTDTLSAFRLDLIGQTGGPTGMQVTSVTRDGASVPFTHANGHLRVQLDAPPAVGDERTYVVTYQGVPADGLIISTNQHGDRTFFGDNWPTRARYWLPSVDHPLDKATVEFYVTAPAHYEVVGNGTLVENMTLTGDRRLTHWRSTAPLPTKVMVIGVADFAVQDVGTYDGVPIQSWVYPEDRERGFRELAQAERIVQFFDEQLGGFPYAKLANVQSTTRYGGMENASAIFYSEAAISDTDNDEPLLAHEIAHQWYGDAVTETGWSHLWLSEGFATYLTQLYLEATYGRERLENGMRRAREQVLQFYRQHPDEPLVDTTYADPNELLNTNPYQKGAWVLHMLRHQVGDSAFWAGLRTYYQRYKNENASTDDFRTVMEEVAGQDLSGFFEQWTRRAGQPKVEGSWSYDAGARQLTVTLRQTQEAAPFRVPIELGIYGDQSKTPRIETMDVRRRRHTFTFDLGAAPSNVVLDPDAWVLMEASFGRR